MKSDIPYSYYFVFCYNYTYVWIISDFYISLARTIDNCFASILQAKICILLYPISLIKTVIPAGALAKTEDIITLLFLMPISWKNSRTIENCRVLEIASQFLRQLGYAKIAFLPFQNRHSHLSYNNSKLNQDSFYFSFLYPLRGKTVLIPTVIFLYYFYIYHLYGQNCFRFSRVSSSDRNVEIRYDYT